MGYGQKILERWQRRKDTNLQSGGGVVSGLLDSETFTDPGKLIKFAQDAIKFIRGFGLVDIQLVDELVVGLDSGDITIAELKAIANSLKRNPAKYHVELASIDRAIAKVKSGG